MATWPDMVEMQRGLALMLQGNPYFAWQYTSQEEGETVQKYHPCRDLSQLDRFADDIFAGVKTAGFYAIRPDNHTRWGAIDLDAHGTTGNRHWSDTARWVFDSLAPRFPELWLVESSPGSFHIVAFLPELVPARDIRAMLRECAPDNVEVFPKQNELDASKPNAKGSLLRFPGKHQLKGTWANILARHGRIDKDVAPLVSKSSKWQQPSEEGQLWSRYYIATRGIEVTQPGQRWRAMQRIAGRLKGRANEAEALWVYTVWHNKHSQAIRTPLEKSRGEFLAWFRKAAPCIVAIPEYALTDAEQAVISALPKMKDLKPELLASTMKLLLDAKKFADQKGVSDFYRSYRDLGENLRIAIPTVSNYVGALRSLKLVHLVERGHTGIANTYRLGKAWT